MPHDACTVTQSDAKDMAAKCLIIIHFSFSYINPCKPQYITFPRHSSLSYLHVLISWYPHLAAHDADCFVRTPASVNDIFDIVIQVAWCMLGASESYHGVVEILSWQQQLGWTVLI